MNRLRADLLLLLAAMVWGLAFVFQKTAMASLGPYGFIMARASVATMALTPLAAYEYMRVRGERSVLPNGLLRAAVVAGLAFVTAAALQQFGLQTASASNGGFLTALYVVLTPPLAWLLRGSRPSPVIVPAVVMSAVGTWMLGGGAFSALSGGDWLIAGCAVFWALHVILSESGSSFDRPITFTCLQFLVVALVAALCAFVFESVTLDALWAASGEILYVGLLSSALTFTILTAALKYAPASEAAVIISTESLFAALSGALLLGEKLTPLAWAGAVLIMAATALVQVRPQATKREAA